MEFEKVFGKINPPPQLKKLVEQGGDSGAGAISVFLTNVLVLIYAAASIIFLFMVIFSAFQWITSGGDKEAVGKARARLVNAIIGIVILALVFVIARVLGQLTGFDFFKTR